MRRYISFVKKRKKPHQLEQLVAIRCSMTARSYTTSTRHSSPFITASGAPPGIHTQHLVHYTHTQEEEEEDPLLLDGASVIP
ncbi:hypothetical protein GHT06_008178 [Daphnia sinensis]|uniref:Uncharacterized protein n=1 Tax=Daphnia sinensis TaxID=1820382 RepID=A0AAD5L0S0_9CRUS|nr:hypothetical protein GHT06_008178 [Daphnia sinensis]